MASVETGRNFTGADLFYEDLREARIANASPDNMCQLPGVSEESSAIWQAEARKVTLPAKPLTLADERRMSRQLSLPEIAA